MIHSFITVSTNVSNELTRLTSGHFEHELFSVIREVHVLILECHISAT